MGSMISGLLGGGQSDAQAGQTAALQQARDAAAAYRPEAMQARLNLLNKASGAYQGMNNALETMYGGRGPKAGVGSPAGMPQQTFGGMQLPQQPFHQEGRPTTGPGAEAPIDRGGFNPIALFDPANVFGQSR